METSAVAKDGLLPAALEFSLPFKADRATVNKVKSMGDGIRNHA
jgi:hypothetical protein